MKQKSNSILNITKKLMIKIILVSIWLLLSPIIYILTTKDWYNIKNT